MPGGFREAVAVRVAAAAVAVTLAAAGCGAAGPAPARSASALETRWRLARARRAAGPRIGATTWVYRHLLGKSLYARCRMVPTDSEAFDQRARRCGALAAAVLGAARLLLETAATPAVLHPVRLDGRLRWLDLVEDGPCGW